MPPPKKKKKKTTKKKTKKSSSAPSHGFYESPFKQSPSTAPTNPDFVTLNLQLIDFNFTPLCVSIPLHNTTFATIARYIEQRHADVRNLRMFLDPPQKDNEVFDFHNTTLQQCNLVAGSTVNVYYNFDVQYSGIGCQRPLHDLTLKVASSGS